MRLSDKISLFKKECNDWLVKFNLSSWEVFYWENEVDDKYKATCDRDSKKCILEFSISTKWIKEATSEDIKHTAKHEAIHALVSEVMCKAFDRFGRERDMLEAEERLVIKLNKLL